MLLSHTEDCFVCLTHQLQTGGSGGENRAKLDPIEVTGAESSERDNDSYYLHDSEKGFTHGCTEVETELFDDLKQYRADGNDNIKVVVSYPNPEHTTNGGTKRDEKEE